MARYHLYLLESSVLPLEGLYALNIRRIFHHLLLAILDCANWCIPCPQTSVGLGREAHVVICRAHTKAGFSITITLVQLLLFWFLRQLPLTIIGPEIIHILYICSL